MAGSILTSELLSPPNGNDYVAGEPFSVASGLDLNPANWATGIIDTVDINGTPTSYHLTYGGANDAYTPNVPGFGGQDTVVTGAGDGTFQIFILTVGSSDSISITPTTMTAVNRVFTCIPNISTEFPDTQTITVTASGAWTFTSSAPWLKVNLVDGTHAQVLASSDPNPESGLPLVYSGNQYVQTGRFTGHVRFTSGTATATLDCTMNVSSPALSGAWVSKDFPF